MKCNLGDVSRITKLAGFEYTKYLAGNFIMAGVPVIQGKNLSNNRLDLSDVKYISEELSNTLERSKIKTDDLLFCYIANIGDVYWHKDKRKLHLGSNVCRITCNQEVIMPEWLYYWFINKKQELVLFAKGSVQKNINMKELRNLKIDVLNLPEQKAIADTLSCLDDKIELNNRMNKTLEEMAQAIFKSWFVDFEPFQDGEFIDSELGPIPKGWRVGTLGELVEIGTKSLSPSASPDVIFEHYSIPAFDEAHFPAFDAGHSIKSNKYIVTDGAWLISKLNPTTKRIWQPLMLTRKPICSTEFMLFTAKNKTKSQFCYELTNSQGFHNYICSNTSGSTNSRQRAIPKSTLLYKIIIPGDSECEHFGKTVEPVYEQMRNNIIQTQLLKELRNSLLPKLMSGEIRVPLEVV